MHPYRYSLSARLVPGRLDCTGMDYTKGNQQAFKAEDVS